ncbi:MAG: hypothetical protein ACJ76P_14120 [Actinomycetota bacterium]|jgi:hypothetical protein
MAMFFVLYSSPVTYAEQMEMSTPEDMKAGMSKWNEWGQKVGDALLDFGKPLGESNRVAGGSTSPGEADARGYSIIEANSLEAATKMVEDHPHLHQPDGWIDVFEMMPAPGM